MIEWSAFRGSHEATRWMGGAATRWLPDDLGLSRYVSKELITPPVTLAGWMLIEEAEPTEFFDGLHIMVPWITNHHNIVVSLARKDGVCVVSRQWGQGNYDDAKRIEGVTPPEQHRLYTWVIEWPSLAELNVEVWTRGADWSLEAVIPGDAQGGNLQGTNLPLLPVGHVGIRADRHHVRGAVMAREGVSSA